MGVAVIAELLADTIRQRSENFGASGGEFGFGESHLGGGIGFGDGAVDMSENIVEFGDEHLDLRNELHQTFGDQGDTEIHLVGGAGGDHIGDTGNDLVKGHFLLSHLFGNDRHIGLGLKSALKGDVGSGTAHELDEVPVFLGGVGVTTDVSDKFGVDTAGGIKTETGFDPLIFQVAVDGLGAADDLDTDLVGFEILSQHAGVGVGVVAADDDQSGDAALFAALAGSFKLLRGFQFGTAGADDVKAAGVAVGVDDVGGQFHSFIFDQTVGSFEESVEFGGSVEGFDTVKETGDDVVSAGSLSAGKDHTHIESGGGGTCPLSKGQHGAAESVGEESFDLLHIVGSGGGFTGGHCHIGAFTQRRRKFGGVSCPDFLERRDNFHCKILSFSRFSLLFI